MCRLCAGEGGGAMGGRGEDSPRLYGEATSAVLTGESAIRCRIDAEYNGHNTRYPRHQRHGRGGDGDPCSLGVRRWGEWSGSVWCEGAWWIGGSSVAQLHGGEKLWASNM